MDDDLTILPGWMQMQFGRPAQPAAGGAQGALPPRPGATVITWMPSGIQSYGKPGMCSPPSKRTASALAVFALFFFDCFLS